MHNTNNFVPVIVQRGARIAAHKHCWDKVNISQWKKVVHRAYRHHMNIEMHKITQGFVDPYEYDDSAPYACRLTAWDVW